MHIYVCVCVYKSVYLHIFMNMYIYMYIRESMFVLYGHAVAQLVEKQRY